MKLAAQRGENSYLVDLGDRQGCVVERRGGEFVAYPPLGVQSILARGYWQEPDSDAPAAEILAAVETK
jgi:hypothetical protein